MTQLLTFMKATREKFTARLATGNAVLGTSYILNGWILTTCTLFSRQVRTRWAFLLFVTLMRYFWVTTCRCRSSTRESTVDLGATCNRRIDDCSTAMADQLERKSVGFLYFQMITYLIVGSLETSATRTLVIRLGTGVSTTAQSLATYKVTFVQIIIRVYVVIFVTLFFVSELDLLPKGTT